MQRLSSLGLLLIFTDCFFVCDPASDDVLFDTGVPSARVHPGI